MLLNWVDQARWLRYRGRLTRPKNASSPAVRPPAWGYCRNDRVMNTQAATTNMPCSAGASLTMTAAMNRAQEYLITQSMSRGAAVSRIHCMRSTAQ